MVIFQQLCITTTRASKTCFSGTCMEEWLLKIIGSASNRLNGMNTSGFVTSRASFSLGIMAWRSFFFTMHKCLVSSGRMMGRKTLIGAQQQEERASLSLWSSVHTRLEVSYIFCLSFENCSCLLSVMRKHDSTAKSITFKRKRVFIC